MTTATFSELNLPVLRIKKEPPRRRTLAEWLAFEARSKHKHEFLEGQIVKMPFAKGPHNEISANVIHVLKTAVRSLPKMYRVYSSDQKIYFPALDEGAYSDALSVCEKPIFWDDEKLLLINPILVVEVLSKSTRKYDREGKFEKYKSLESFREYVLVEQNFCRVETRFREEPGLWRETIYSKMDEQVVLKSLGVSIVVADIYEHIEFEK